MLAPPPRLVNKRPSRDTLLARGIPEIHLRHVFDREPTECPALTEVQKFMDADQGTFLVLSGTVGTYKSGSAAWALTKHPGVYVRAAKLGTLALEKGDEGADRYHYVRVAPLLVLDDLGGEYLSDRGWFERVLTSLCDERYGSMLKTVITTNLDGEAFKKAYGERVADRIRESNGWYEVPGGSRRAAQAEQEGE
jgi:DNA replication protein DnaC